MSKQLKVYKWRVSLMLSHRTTVQKREIISWTAKMVRFIAHDGNILLRKKESPNWRWFETEKEAVEWAILRQSRVVRTITESLSRAKYNLTELNDQI